MEKGSRFPWGKGRIVWTRDATADDSDKSFTVPTGKIWKINTINATLVSTATVGNRLMAIRITDGTNTLMEGYANMFQAASLTVMYYWHIGPGLGVPSTAAGGSGNSYQGLPGPLILPAGYVIRVLDASAIDATHDDLTVVLHYLEYDA